MPAPQFSRSAGEPRLYWLDDSAWGSNGGFALVLFAGSAPGPATLTLAQSFTGNPGHYVTIAERPQAAAETGFVEAVLALAEGLGTGARFFWIEDPVFSRDWGRRVLYVRQEPNALQGRIDRPTVFPLGRYRFSVSAGQAIAASADGFSILGEVEPPFQFLTDDKAWVLAAASPGATVISAAGAKAGTFRLDFSLDSGVGPDGLSDFDRLDVGFRFGMADWSRLDLCLLDSLDYPLFREPPATPVAMTLQVDPAAPLDPARTLLSYRGSAAPIGTHYSSRLGYGVALAPAASTSDGPGPGFGFHKRPGSTVELADDDPLYLAPVGPFAMTVGGPAAELTGGLSGIEYFHFSTAAPVPITFVPGQPAYAPSFPAEAAAGREDPAPGPGSLTMRATTAFAAIAPPSGGQATYFAQPEGAPFFQLRGTRRDDPLLSYLVLLDLVSGPIAAPLQPYPLLPYAGLSEGGDLARPEALERQILSPWRRSALGASAGDPFLRPPMAMLEDGSVQGVTPQGVLANFTDDVWESIVLSPARAGSETPQLAFNLPSARLRGALQSNQLFLVAADGALLMENSGFHYWITDSVLGDLARLTGSEAVPQATIARLVGAGQAPQSSLAAFTALLQGLLTGADSQYIPTIVKYGVYFELEVEGWRFRLSPSLWASRPHRPVMILKYAAGALDDFVRNTDSWAWPEIAGIDGSIAATQTLLGDILEQAKADVKTSGTGSRLYNFVTDVVLDPGWTGLVLLNADVPFSSVPPELAGLAAGIDASEFRAHHVGISVTPVTVDAPCLSLAQSHSAIFGLIDYDQPEDIAHIEGDFGFKVLLLQVLFVNSAIASFAARIELFVNRLFGELVTLYDSVHYNNLLLDGSYQHHGGVGHYVFAANNVSVFGAASVGTGGSTTQTVLLQSEIDQVQFVTATPDTAFQTTVRNRFLLNGRLRFAGLDGFDAFSFGPTLDVNGAIVADGYLAFTRVSVNMDFPVDAPETRVFEFDLDDIDFDPAASFARPTSFFQRFPLQIAGMIRGTSEQKPQDRGYMPLETPLSQPGFTGDWFGLLFAVDLGTLGALSSAPGLSATILAAWSPGANGHDVNIGLKMPGIESARTLLPLQGVIDLGFQAIDLQAAGALDNPPDPSYSLRFRNFYLRFLGWKFPPGQNSITLFGNPEAATQSLAASRGALGWYAAYAKKE